MRVRTSADTIRNMERLLAFDEAAGSKGIWTDDAGSRMASAHGQGGVTHQSGGKPRNAQHSPVGRHSSMSGDRTLGSSATIDRL
jgi:hypothetical protein